jgi:hypothetical protein
VVYVETADGIRVEGILDVPDPSAVSIGQPVCLAAVTNVPRYRLAEVQPDERKRDE